jgi:prepilin-type N-terminal cleavage/methylation domain-containing protein
MRHLRVNSTRPHQAAPAARRGMTLIEVMVALVIVVGATLAMGGFVNRFIHTVSVSSIRATATELAADRLETVKAAASYDSVLAAYAGTERTIAGRPGFERRTVVTRVVTTGREDYAIVTAIVSANGLPTPVKKTTIISSF